jgi:hypothetical protein
VKEYLNLNTDDELLHSISLDYHPKAHKAEYQFHEQLRAKGVGPLNAEQANDRVQCQEWVTVISSTLWEFRTSLVYAEAHSRRRPDGQDPSPPDPPLAFYYFIENAATRAYSVVEKAAQLLNVVGRLGLAEVRKVTGKSVRKKLKPLYVTSLDRLLAILKSIGTLRNDHIHRFDPGIPRTEVVEVEVEIEGGPVSTAHLYRLRERPLSASQQLDTCRKAYIGLDNELTELFNMVATDLA